MRRLWWSSQTTNGESLDGEILDRLDLGPDYRAGMVRHLGPPRVRWNLPRL
jgi:hypothetical protein